MDMLLSVVDGTIKPRPKAADRIDAARLLLDRAWGRPVQTTELTGPGGGPIQSLNIMASVDTATLYKLVELRDQLLALSADTPLDEAEALENDDEKALRLTVPDADTS